MVASVKSNLRLNRSMPILPMFVHGSRTMYVWNGRPRKSTSEQKSTAVHTSAMDPTDDACSVAMGTSSEHTVKIFKIMNILIYML